METKQKKKYDQSQEREYGNRSRNSRKHAGVFRWKNRDLPIERAVRNGFEKRNAGGMEPADFNRQSQTSIARKKGEELERKKLFPGKLQVIIEQML
jgi:hypothetical protein